MNKVIFICLLGALLSTETVSAGRYTDGQQRDNDEQAQPQTGPKQARPPLHNAPPPAQANRDERRQEPPPRNERNDSRDNRDNRDNRGDDRHQRRDDQQERRDDRNQRRDDRQERRDDRNRHWDGGHHRRDDHQRRWDGGREHRRDDHNRHWDGGHRRDDRSEWRPVIRHHPRHGHVVRRLPHGFLHLILHTRDYYYYDGIFYRPHSKGYVVVGAPIGAVLAELPRPFEMILVDGVPYYVVGDSYFVDDRAGFRVVTSPFEITPTAPASGQIGGDLFIYPANGQSAEQQSRDRYECHRWGVSQTGFDPSTAQIPNDARLPDYRRAMSACLEARGYTVK